MKTPIKRAIVLLLLSIIAGLSLSAQMIEGKVTDSNQEPLIGVPINVKGTQNGTLTDIDGLYKIEAAGDATLVFTCMSFKTQEVAVNGKKVINVVLEESMTGLNEVVVVGYGTQKKANLTGSVASVGGQELETRVNTDVMKSLQGQIPGVTIISRPGGNPTINIRGRGNMESAAPLFVIDGIIADGELFSALDPYSIESISILKDAASAAIYGARASFGVVLVTTKSGKKGDMKINYNGVVGVKKQKFLPKIVSSEWYARLYNEAMWNGDPTVEGKYSREAIDRLADGSMPDFYPNTNWYDLLERSAVITQHSLNISGGDKVRYATTLGYTRDNTFIPGEHNNRYNLSTNISSDVKKWLTFRAGFKYIQRDVERDKGNISYMDLLIAPRTYVGRHSDGSWGTRDAGNIAPANTINRNPMRKHLDGSWSTFNTKHVVTDLAMDIKPMEGLVLTGQMTYKVYDYKSKVYEASRPDVFEFETGNKIGDTNKISKMTYDWSESTQTIYNGLANYTIKLNEDHDLSALAGVSYENFESRKSKSHRQKFPSNTIPDMNGGSAVAGDMYAEGGAGERKMFSVFGRLNYSYKGKYLAEANMRGDASSRFHKDERWGYFPSFSAGWRISEESFMGDTKTWLDDLKIRASWGKLGNINNVGDYDYYGLYESNIDQNYNFGDVGMQGIREKRLPSPSLTWEKTTITDVGLDAVFFNNKLSLTTDFYIKDTDDILRSYEVPWEIGAPSKPSLNMASVRNKGFEIALTHNNKVGEIGYSIGGSLSKNWNKITKLPVGDPSYADEIWIFTRGRSIGSFVGYKTDGLLTQEDIDNGNYLTEGGSFVPQAGDIKYVKLDKNDTSNVLTEDDRTVIGKDTPDFTYGINFSVNYKNFELSAFGQGVRGAQVLFINEQVHPFFNFGNPRDFHMGRWTEENPNPNATYPRIYVESSQNAKYNAKVSDFWLFNANYFRVKNLTLGYNVPKTFLNKLDIASLRLYFAVEDPFTIRGDKRMKDFDPEARAGRTSEHSGISTYSFGLNFSF